MLAATCVFLLAGGSLSGQINFDDVTLEAGLYEPLRGMKGHGAAWGVVNGNGYPDLFYGTFADFDNDGDLDLAISHQHHIDLPYGKLGNFLFENDGCMQ